MLHLPSQPGSPQLEIRRAPKKTAQVSTSSNSNLRPAKTRERTRRSDLEQHRGGDIPPLPRLLSDGLPQFRPRQLGDDWLADAHAEVRELLPVVGRLEPLLVDEVKQEASLVTPFESVGPPPAEPSLSFSSSSRMPASQGRPSTSASALASEPSGRPAQAREPVREPEPKPKPRMVREPPELRQPTRARRVGVVSIANAVGASGTHNVLLGLRDFFDRPALAGSSVIGIRNLAKVHEFEIDDRFTYFLNQARSSHQLGTLSGRCAERLAVTSCLPPACATMTI